MHSFERAPPFWATSPVCHFHFHFGFQKWAFQRRSESLLETTTESASWFLLNKNNSQASEVTSFSQQEFLGPLSLPGQTSRVIGRSGTGNTAAVREVCFWGPTRSLLNESLHRDCHLTLLLSWHRKTQLWCSVFVMSSDAATQSHCSWDTATCAWGVSCDLFPWFFGTNFQVIQISPFSDLRSHKTSAACGPQQHAPGFIQSCVCVLCIFPVHVQCVGARLIALIPPLHSSWQVTYPIPQHSCDPEAILFMCSAVREGPCFVVHKWTTGPGYQILQSKMNLCCPVIISKTVLLRFHLKTKDIGESKNDT